MLGHYDLLGLALYMGKAHKGLHRVPKMINDQPVEIFTVYYL